MKSGIVAIPLAAWALSLPALIAGPDQDAAAYSGAIARVNDAHVRQPGKRLEADLAKQLPPAAKSALKRVLDAKASPDLAPALLRCGEAALDLDLMDDFQAVRTKLAALSPPEAARLGAAVSRPRFIVRGIGDFRKALTAVAPGKKQDIGIVFQSP